MDFANAMKEESKFTRTENGAVALNTTNDARLDLFGTIGALRDADENRITTLFSEAYQKEDDLAEPAAICRNAGYVQRMQIFKYEKQRVSTSRK